MLCNIVIHKGVLNTLKNTTFENRYRIVLEQRLQEESGEAYSKNVILVDNYCIQCTLTVIKKHAARKLCLRSSANRLQEWVSSR